VTERARDLAQASVLLDLKRYDEAASLLARIVTAEPQNSRAWCLLATAHLGAGRYEEAAAAASRAITVSTYGRNAKIPLQRVLLGVWCAMLMASWALAIALGISVSRGAAVLGYTLAIALATGYGAVQLWWMPPETRRRLRTRRAGLALGALYGAVLIEGISAAVMTWTGPMPLVILASTALICAWPFVFRPITQRKGSKTGRDVTQDRATFRAAGSRSERACSRYVPVFLACCLFLAAVLAVRAQYPSSTDAHHPSSTDPATRLRWAYTTGGGIDSSPAVAGGAVYVGYSDGNGDGKVYALDAATGHVRWAHATRDLFDSSPAAAGGTVYIGSGDGNVYALDAATGHLRWAYTTRGPVDSGPAVAAGTVYVGSEDGKVYALDAATGQVLWTYAAGGGIDSGPAVAGGTVYVGSEDGTVYALKTAQSLNLKSAANPKQ
jgi:hypothetical protein